MTVNKEGAYRCIYCLQDKSADAFNTEHVISRMMGTYDGNSLVLNHYEVCKDCNDYFSRELESRISLNSYEAFSRIIYGQRPTTKKRRIGGVRLSFSGENSAFYGMPLNAYTSTNDDTKIEFRPDSFIAIYDFSHTKQYRFYSIEEIASVSFEDIKASQNSKHPIRVCGYQLEEVIAAFKKAGISFNGLTAKSSSFNDVFPTDELIVTAQGQTDLYTRRYAGKVLMNFLCYMYGRDFVLQPAFDVIRRFVREGTEIDPQHMFISFSDSLVLPDFPCVDGRCHIVGTALTKYNNEDYLCGFVSWYNQFFYAFLLCQAYDNAKERYPTCWVVCNNETRNIKIGPENGTISLEWPKDI